MPSSVDSAVVFAGGLGTRLRNIVPDVPKPMAPVRGRPFLEHQMDYWIAQGIRRFILAVGYKHEVISAHFGAKYKEASIEYSIERSPLGTGGGMLLARHKLMDGKPFLILNGDTFFEVSLEKLFELHAEKHSDWTFSLFETDDRTRYLGLRTDVDGRIIALRSNESGTLFANGGVYLASMNVFDVWHRSVTENTSLENDLLPALMRSGKRVFGYVCAGRFIDIGVPEDYARAGAILGP